MPKLRLPPKNKAVEEQPPENPDPPVNRRATRKSLRVQGAAPDPVPTTSTPSVGRPKKTAVPPPAPEPVPSTSTPAPSVGRPKKTAVPPPTPDPAPTTSTPSVGRPKKTAVPPQPPTTDQNITLNNVSPQTARTLSIRTPVVRLQRCGPRTRNSLPTEPEQDPPPQDQQPQNPAPRRKKRVRREPQPPPNDTIEDDPPSRHNILLPSPDSFPSSTDSGADVINKLKELRDSVRQIFSLVMDQIQSDDDSTQPCYESVQKVYEYFDKVVGRGWGEEERVSFGGKYRNVCVHALYSFGAVVWKQNLGKGATCNPFATNVAKFLEYCFIHLGWKAERGRAGMTEWKDPKYAPAAYYVVKMFYKYHSDKDHLTRQHQLSLINKLLESAHRSNNNTFIEFVWETIGKVVMIRVKDKSAQCRVLSLKILAFFVGIEEATGVCQKELKYYTRYDPYVEVRRLGTKILGDKTRMKMRFFFDQAFDKNEGVRVEAFRALGVEGEGGELVREMDGLSSERLCKVIVWGAMHSGPKLREIIKCEILPKWMKISCKSDLVKFLLNIDAYQHMKAVVRILDMLLTTQEQEQFVESIDLSFINTIKQNVKDKKYKELSIEAFVAWLGLCKASKGVASIREKVVPSSEELVGIIAGLHEGVFQEHEEAKDRGRNEDITPVFCLVIGLEVGRGFVHWEEGGRRELVRLLREILLDPLLDERVVVIQAINTLHSFVDEVEFEDIMMNVFQEVFDSRSGFNRTVVQDEGGDVEMDEEVVEQVVEEVEPEPEPEPERIPLTTIQLARLKEKVCEVAMKRVNLQKDKDDLLKRKMFIDAAPVSNEIGKLQTEEATLKAQMREEEEYAKEWKASAERRAVEERERVVEVPDGVGMEEEESVGVVNRTGIISSVEEGLSKGMFMINAFLDLCPKMGGFVRSLYDGHIPGFMIEKDVTIRTSVLQFLTRIAMIDKGEVRKVFCFLVNMMLGEAEVELKNVAFQCVVDLVVCFEFADFCLTGGEVFEGEEVHPFLGEMTKHMNAVVPELCVDYTLCTPEIMEKFVMELLTVRFPPLSDRMNQMEINLLNMSKNVGLLKLVVRGRLRDPVILARILCLWANQDYAGTAVLRDLEHVLKLYDTFEWWGGEDGVVEEIEGEVEEGGVRGGVMSRVLGVAVGEGAIMLCSEGGGGKEGEEVIVKFVGYFLSFVGGSDQPLMRTIVTTILTPICNHPTRSYNSMLVKCASKVPITSRVSATAIIKVINEAFIKINEHPATSSIRVLRRELLGYLGKLKRLFGDEIAVLTDGSGREVVVGRVLTGEEDEDDDELEEEEGRDVCSFDSERGTGSEVENL